MKTKTKMRMLSLLLCFVMLVGLMPTTVFAAKSATVTTYNELWSAVFSKDDYYITLGSDITYAVPGGGNTPLSPWQYLLNVNGTKNKTIDLNGHTLQVSNKQTSWMTQDGLFNIDGTASLTVMNGTIMLDNYVTKDRADKGVFNACGGNLTLINVNILNGREGTAVNAQGDATVTIEGGTISAFSSFAVTAVGTSSLTLDKNVVLTTTDGSGVITQPADSGYGSLHASTSNLNVVSAMFVAGIEVPESTISQFSASANRLVFVDGTQYNSAFATSKSGDYYWYTNATSGCALVVNDSGYAFAKNVNVISTAAKQPVVVTNGTASPNQAAYGATVTITADDIQGKVFSGWTVESGDVTLADSSDKTTSFTMGAKAVKIRADYDNIPISSAKFTVATPVQGEHPSAATTTTEHITVSETWCVEIYDDNSFSSTLPDSHTFEGGHTYRVGVAFEVEQGYALDNSFSVKFVDPISGTETPASQGGTQYMWLADYTVENNSVEITSVTATVSGAAAGATAGSTAVTTNDTTYTVSIKGWYDCDNVFSWASAPVLQATDTFVGGKTYTVGVTFTPVGSNTLANDPTTSINGKSGMIGGWDGNSRNYFITISIPASQPITYTVSFDANGGTGTMADVTGISGDYVLPVCGFTAPNSKQFKAWSVGGVEKTAGATITVNANTTVTAVWENIPVTYYTVTFDSNGGSAVTAQSIEAGQKATKPADPTKGGFDFKGWTLNGSAYDFNTAVNGNITLVATWEQKQVVPTTYTVSFAANGGTGTMADVTGISGEYTLPANGFTAPAGKQFKAWSVDGNEKAVGDKITVTADTTVKAVWETIPAGHTHNYGADWKFDSVNHWKECSCADKDEVDAHSFKWVVDKEATETEKGSKHEECTVCGYKKDAVEIPATGTPKTGDSSNMLLWAALLLAGGLGTFGTVAYSKKRKEDAE